MAKTKKGFYAKLLGSIAKLVVMCCQFVFVLLWKIIWNLGLLLPIIYLIFGGVLSLLSDFEPFGSSLESVLYVFGLIICCICSLIIAVKNVIIKPAQNFKEGYKNPVWKKKEEDKIITKQAVAKPKKNKPRLLPIDRENVKTVEILSSKKFPKRYYSVLEEDTLIYEFEDRFEVFKEIRDKEIYVKTEYK